MKQIDLIDVQVTASYYLQGDISILRAGDYEMSVSGLQNGSAHVISHRDLLHYYHIFQRARMQKRETLHCFGELRYNQIYITFGKFKKRAALLFNNHIAYRHIIILRSNRNNKRPL